MIEGSTIRLRAWQERDVPVLQGLRNDVALQARLLARARGSDTSQVRDWLERRSAGPDSVLFVVADKSDDLALGFVQFIGLDPADRRAELGIGLASGAQGRGVGTEAIALGLEHLVRTHRTRKVNLQVRADLDRAIRCYRRLGFEECGRLREHFHFEGVWHDVVLMEHFLERC